MKFIKQLKDNLPIRINLIFLSFLLVIKGLFSLFHIFIEYLYMIDFLNGRLFFILCILVLLQSLLNLQFVKDLQHEMFVFNEGPANKSFFITYLRKYHYFLLLFGYLLYGLAVTYFVEEPLISYSLGLISFISLILYLVQFVVYTNEYVKKSFKFNKNILSKNKIGQIRNMVTASTLKQAAVVCVECVKVVVTVGVSAEVGYKLTHRGMNDVSPWRQHWLNQSFPDDKTKIWTESKAAIAAHNRAMGYSHTDTYDSIPEKIIKTLPRNNK